MNLNIWQIIFLALLQGITELFPISSLGHTVILPSLFGWGDLVRNDSFLPLIVALHLGTSIALVIYFWRDWLQVGRSVVKSVKEGEVRRGTEEWVSFLIIIGCVPAGAIGVFLDKAFKTLFASPLIASTFLIVNGSLLFLGERMRLKSEAKYANLSSKEREAQFRPLASLSSGATMVAGLGVRLTHEDAARFSFLLGTPLIGAAALLEVPQLFHLPTTTLLLVFMGMVLSGIAAFLSTKFLLKYFETGRLYPFAAWCWIGGLLALVIFLTVFHATS
jgi:undecaprenyl-diphosphatase